MNPFNLLINYVIANSRASFYNVPENQEITNMALLTGMVSENPLMSYLIIDNKAKIESEKFSTTTLVATPPKSTDETPKLPPATGTETPPKDPKGNETTPENNTVTLEAIRTEISENKTALATITTQCADLNAKITTIDNDNKKLRDTIAEIQVKLTEISKRQQTPDSLTETKNVVTQKVSPKTDPK